MRFKLLLNFSDFTFMIEIRGKGMAAHSLRKGRYGCSIGQKVGLILRIRLNDLYLQKNKKNKKKWKTRLLL